jgi:opacity protein-like surface antigen
MRKLKMTMMGKLLGLTAAALLAVPMGANAAEPGMYAGGHVGRNDLDHWPLTVDFGGIASEGNLTLDKTPHWGLFVGRQRENTRLELEYEQGRFDVTSATVGPVTLARNARGEYRALLVNGYRTFDVRPDFNVYGALGVGLARVSLPNLSPFNGCNCLRAAVNTDVVFQARIGAEYRFGGENNVFLQYTALYLPSTGSGAPAPLVNYGYKALGAVTVGYRTSF